MSNDFAPKVSVVMSCFNEEQWVGECIDSVLSQSFSDFEFIIVDDGSTDKTIQIIKRYMLVDERVKLYARSNFGLTNSLNYGIKRAKGEWVARIDADDTALEGRFSSQLDAVREDPEVVYVGGGCRLVRGDGCFLDSYQYPTTHDRLLRSLCRYQRFPPHSSAFFKKDAWQLVGGYRSNMAKSQDIDLWLRLAEIGGLACVNREVVSVRIHDKQISSGKGADEQLVYSSAARIGYILRNQGFLDPVCMEFSEFQKFKKFVETKLGIREQKVLVIASSAREFIRSPRYQSFVVLLKISFLNPVEVYLFIRRYHFGNSMGYRMAKSWVRAANS